MTRVRVGMPPAQSADDRHGRVGWIRTQRDLYAVERRVGAGTTASVYLARALARDRLVAVKYWDRFQDADSVWARKRERTFANEVSICKALKHPNILELQDWGWDHGCPFLVMAYVEGGRSLDSMRDQPASLDNVVERLGLVIKCAHALSYAHGLGVVHRDIKPSNILLQADGEPLVADFGIAVAEAQDSSFTAIQGVGSPAFMAPEQLADEVYSAQSDLFSLGAVLYTLLAGRAPFTEATVVETMRHVMHERHLPLREASEGLPRRLDYVLDRALQKHPGARYRSMMELAADLELIRDELQGTAPMSWSHWLRQGL